MLVVAPEAEKEDGVEALTTIVLRHHPLMRVWIGISRFIGRDRIQESRFSKGKSCDKCFRRC